MHGASESAAWTPARAPLLHLTAPLDAASLHPFYLMCTYPLLLVLQKKNILETSVFAMYVYACSWAACIGGVECSTIGGVISMMCRLRMYGIVGMSSVTKRGIGMGGREGGWGLGEGGGWEVHERNVGNGHWWPGSFWNMQRGDIRVCWNVHEAGRMHDRCTPQSFFFYLAKYHKQRNNETSSSATTFLLSSFMQWRDCFVSEQEWFSFKAES